MKVLPDFLAKEEMSSTVVEVAGLFLPGAKKGRGLTLRRTTHSEKASGASFTVTILLEFGADVLVHDETWSTALRESFAGMVPG
jgi:hypothetical protein